jgi:hypothetical protein
MGRMFWDGVVPVDATPSRLDLFRSRRRTRHAAARTSAPANKTKMADSSTWNIQDRDAG